MLAIFITLLMMVAAFDVAAINVAIDRVVAIAGVANVDAVM